MILALSETSISTTAKAQIKMFDSVKMAYSSTVRAKLEYLDDAWDTCSCAG